MLLGKHYAGYVPPVKVKWLALAGTCLLALCVPAFSASGSASTAATDKVEIGPPLKPVRPEPTYILHAGVEGEIYPAFANYASLQRPEERRWGTVAVTITNSTDRPLRNRLTVEVPGWSDVEIQIAEMRAGEVRTFLFAPSFLPRLYNNREIAAATAAVTATDMAGRVLYAGTTAVRLRAVGDMFWGTEFKYAPFIASWVTPHDPLVEEVLSRAKEFMPGRRLPGYEPRKTTAAQEKSTRLQARAIYQALQRSGVSYVKSSLSFGGNRAWSERVRTPRESLRQRSANCIDATVLYASLFENLGMEPVVLVVPGHAYIGVRVARGSTRYLFIDAALTGRASFEAAVAAAESGLDRVSPSEMRFIRIGEARQAGIFPLPLP